MQVCRIFVAFSRTFFSKRRWLSRAPHFTSTLSRHDVLIIIYPLGCPGPDNPRIERLWFRLLHRFRISGCSNRVDGQPIPNEQSHYGSVCLQKGWQRRTPRYFSRTSSRGSGTEKQCAPIVSTTTPGLGYTSQSVWCSTTHGTSRSNTGSSNGGLPTGSIRGRFRCPTTASTWIRRYGWHAPPATACRNPDDGYAGGCSTTACWVCSCTDGHTCPRTTDDVLLWLYAWAAHATTAVILVLKIVDECAYPLDVGRSEFLLLPLWPRYVGE